MNGQQQQNIIVVGGGLAGLTAAIEAHNQNGAKVILIEKEKNIGGNSMKATSGINAVEPITGDTREAFIQDTLKSGGICRQDLVEKLVDESRPALDWLIKTSQDQDGKPTLDLSVVSRCGGHTFGRTHRCPPAENGLPVPVGWKLIDTLKKKFMSFSDVQVITNTRVLSLLTETDVNGATKVVGVQVLKTDPETEQETKQEIHAAAVVLTSGGFGGQTGQQLPDGNSTLLSEFTPQLLHTATTNGPWANGDGVRLGLGVGAAMRDMV